MTSYIQLLNKIEAFCDAHLQIQRYGGEFREQMPNLSTKEEKYPLVFVTPTNGTPNYDTNQISLDIYCVDLIEEDRSNLNTIVSDCHLMLTDLYGYFSQGDDLAVDVIGNPSQEPLNNLDLDYVAGWKMTIVFEVDGYCVDAIPMTPIVPGEPTCDDGTVENSDATYSNTVASGGTLVLPDSQINVNSVDQGDVVSVKTIDVNVQDSGGTVTPDSTSLVGNTLTITVPAAATCSVGLKVLKTNQTTSYRTGDDGNLKEGRDVDFFTLDANNPFGNTNRFTDELGGQTYTNDIILDWSTYNGSEVLGFYRVISGVFNWNDSIDNAIAFSHAGFTSGWKLPNAKEMMLIMNHQSGNALNYAPFNLTSNVWTSTTATNNTGVAYYGGYINGVVAGTSKAGGIRYIPCRNFTNAELGI